MSEKGLVDPIRLTGWMDAEGLAPGEPLTLTRITTGHSNELFEIRRGRLRLALRRPPATPLSPTAHDMYREYRVISALEGSVPVPKPVRLCPEPDVIGAPFYLMEMIEGVVARHSVPEALEGSGHDIAGALIDTLARIHDVDPRTVGLGDFGRPDGFLERQVSRWRKQLESYRMRPLPWVDEMAEWLEDHMPDHGDVGILHGDYTLVNVMFAPRRPVRLIAVLDWEQSTVGDPLVDLGWLLGLWHDPGEEALPGAEPGVLGLPGTDMPTRWELAERYAEVSGRDLKHLTFYAVLAIFKLVCIMEGSYARYVGGTSNDPYFAALEHSIPELARRGLRYCWGEL